MVTAEATGDRQQEQISSVTAADQVQVRFHTRQTKYAVTDAAILVPARLRRYGLSEIINHLLELPTPVPFDFLIDGKFLPHRTSLSQYLETNGLSSENVLELENVEASLPPSEAAKWEHDDWVASVKASRTSSLVLSGSYDACARIWDRSGNCRAVCKGHRGPVKAVAWMEASASKSMEEETKLQFVTGDGKDGTVFAWEYDTAAATTKISYECVGHAGAINAIAVSPDNSQFATASWDSSILLWSTDAEDVEENQGEGRAKRRKVGQDSSASGSVPAKRALKRLTGHVGAVSSIVYQRTQGNALFSGGWDHSVRVWDVETGSSSSSMNCERVVLAMDHSSVNGLLVTGHSDPVIRIWDPRATEGLVVKLGLHGHKNWVSSVAWSPSSAYTFTSGSYDSTIKVWDIRSTTPLYSLSGTGGEKAAKVFAVDWVADWIFSGGEDAEVRCFTAKGGQSSA
ncbi:hypothetical protein HDU85_002727 [Gaertneriomyces sp. JEL0708]|nr:hypothetical protein HDU85_002727 [Gaertneriomyces sp. JEL0708]